MLERLQPQWIDTPPAVLDLARVCEEAGAFALDTEADSLHSYFHKTCLIQVTAGELNAVIDPLALETPDLAPLFEVCTNPDVTVYMHGADYDIRVLDRDYDAHIRGLVDTQIMAQLLGEARTGLATLLEANFSVALDKKHQRADWGRRPLGSSMLAYAAADTAFLVDLANSLKKRLVDMDRWGWAREEFAKLEQVRHGGTEPDIRAFEKVKGVGTLRGPARDRAFTLFQWRDSEARRRDVPPFKVLGNRTLLSLSVEPPQDRQALPRVEGIGPRFAARFGAKILKILANPDSSPDRRRSPRRPAVEPAVKARVKRLTAERDRIAAELEISGGLLCPRAHIAAVAEIEGKAADEATLWKAGLAGWRLDVLSEPFLEVLTDGDRPSK